MQNLHDQIFATLKIMTSGDLRRLNNEIDGKNPGNKPLNKMIIFAENHARYYTFYTFNEYRH